MYYIWITNGSVVATYYVSFNQSVQYFRKRPHRSDCKQRRDRWHPYDGIASQANITVDPSSVEITKITEECSTSYCLNGGICSLLNGLRVCQCPIGYEGDICEIAPSTQAPSTLDDSTMATESIAQTTNEESSSQIQITEECSTSYCLNGGICSLLNGLRVCQCPIGYEGDICEIAPSTQAPPILHDSTMATENIAHEPMRHHHRRYLVSLIQIQLV
ncbi:hepatocyte growth factor activator-like [Lytechinus variegatus]|uniref:hepatocyte growth factor activator-like n=1 Tax=Lytechinus variegatus TaxID=7654 RepID=UPI001BB2A75D|nr:hepatocyte growth factor activator-like [Lytechinus variegatus]